MSVQRMRGNVPLRYPLHYALFNMQEGLNEVIMSEFTMLSSGVMKMTRELYFYENPIDAFCMKNRFKIKILSPVSKVFRAEIKGIMYKEVPDWLYGRYFENYCRGINRGWKYYVNEPDSFFNPMAGDVVQALIGEKSILKVTSDNSGSQKDGLIHLSKARMAMDDRVLKIIQRDGKEFVMPTGKESIQE